MPSSLRTLHLCFAAHEHEQKTILDLLPLNIRPQLGHGFSLTRTRAAMTFFRACLASRSSEFQKDSSCWPSKLIVSSGVIFSLPTLPSLATHRPMALKLRPEKLNPSATVDAKPNRRPAINRHNLRQPIRTQVYRGDGGFFFCLPASFFAILAAFAFAATISASARLPCRSGLGNGPT